MFIFSCRSHQFSSHWTAFLLNMSICGSKNKPRDNKDSGKGLVIIYREGGGWCNVKYAMLDFCWPPPHPPLSFGMHETKSMYLSSHHVQLIDILFKATLNLDLSFSSPTPCVDNCRIDIKVLGALNHFSFFSQLLFLFHFFVLISPKQGNCFQGTTTQKHLMKNLLANL